MSDSTDRIVALKEVLDRAQIDVMVTLTQGEVELELERSKLASTWQPNTAYNVNDVVLPEIRNGHSYVCIQPGTSQAGARSYTDWPTSRGASLSDGGSDPILIWEEIGTDRFNPTIAGAESNVYDIALAAKRCWLLKARRATQLLDDGDVEFSQIRKNCLEMAETFRPFRRPMELVRV